eukprot:1161467-Pelagomonas_calceolata.AAC.9
MGDIGWRLLNRFLTGGRGTGLEGWPMCGSIFTQKKEKERLHSPSLAAYVKERSPVLKGKAPPHLPRGRSSTEQQLGGVQMSLFATCLLLVGGTHCQCRC